MVKVVFVSSAGERREIEAQAGMTVMEVAVKNGIDEVVGECGGACACATCHVYVAPDWAKKLPKASPMESDMLDFAIDPRPTSRLSCQISLTPELDGIVIETPLPSGLARSLWRPALQRGLEKCYDSHQQGVIRSALAEMSRQAAVALYVVAMAAVIVGCRYLVLQKPIRGTADGEYRHCPGVRSFLLEILRAAMNSGGHEQGAIAPWRCDGADLLRTRQYCAQGQSQIEFLLLALVHPQPQGAMIATPPNSSPRLPCRNCRRLVPSANPGARSEIIKSHALGCFIILTHILVRKVFQLFGNMR